MPPVGERSQRQDVAEDAWSKVLPKLRIHLDDISHPATATFLSLVDCSNVLRNAVRDVFQTLYIPHGRDSVPKVRSITLVLRPMGGVAYTTGIPLDDMHKEIHLSLDYLEHFVKEPVRFRDEAIGVITHEMVHCWQHNCHGTAPGGLIEGVADYVRLKSGLAPPHWKKTRDGLGEKWDAGYQQTAWFLAWLEEKHGVGTVSRMNEVMGKGKYEKEKFWTGLFDEQVDALWKSYLDSWTDEEAARGTEATSSTGTEPELIELDESEKAEAAEHEAMRAVSHQ